MAHAASGLSRISQAKPAQSRPTMNHARLKSCGVARSIPSSATRPRHLQFVATDVATTTSRLPGIAGHLASNHCFLWIFCLLSGRHGQVQPVSSHSRSNTRAGPEAERLGGLEITQE
jgi:hypothetical protein